MSRYRKIEVRTWSDEKFRSLSPMQPSGQALWFFLLTGPHTGPVPGLFRAGPAAMAEELGWPVEAFREAFREVSDKGMAEADFDARLVWLPNAIRHNKPESPNVVRSWRAEIDMLPECNLKKRAIEAIREYLAELGTPYLSAFCDIFEPSPKASSKPSGKPSAKAMPNQEQEQEQEQRERRASPLGSRLPPDWSLPDEWRVWAEHERPDVDVPLEAAKFRDFWHAKPGKDGRKADWQATWRNWIRRADPGRRRGPAAAGSGGEDFLARAI